MHNVELGFGMNKRVATIVVVVVGGVALSSGYDFWRGYHETHSVEGGVVYTVLGFVVLGLIGLVHFMRSGK